MNDLVLFYADIGRPYMPLITQMVASARTVMPGWRLVLLTPTPSKELCALFDYPVEVKISTNEDNICYNKARCILTWERMTDRPFVMCDPDIEFKRPLAFPEEDIGLLWRRTHYAQPVNGGMIFIRPGCKEFLAQYGNIVASLPKTFHAWWGDQLALSIMIGSHHQTGEVISAWGSTVKLIDWKKVCTTPAHATEETYAIHYKGSRKAGEGWDKIFLPRKNMVAA